MAASKSGSTGVPAIEPVRRSWLASLVRWAFVGGLAAGGGLATALAVVCTAWALFLGLVLLNGYRGTGASVVDIVRNYTGPWAYEPHDSLANLGLELSRRASDRWALLWRDLTP